jgi:predicted phosphodiesterase
MHHDMRQPVRIFSDLHLGHAVSRIQDVSVLRGLIAGAGTVIFNGDTWQELASPFRGQAKVMLRALQALCTEEGADAIFLPGNHDPSWPGRGWVELADGRIIVMHGDALMHAGAPWKREVLSASGQVREIWARFPGATNDPVMRLEVAREVARELCSIEHPLGRHILQRTWDAVTPPVRALWMLHAWFTQGPMADAFFRRYFPAAELLVIGHFHRCGTWQHGGRTVINTGSFLDPGRAHWVEWEDGWLVQGEIDESPDACSLGKRLRVWHF